MELLRALGALSEAPGHELQGLSDLLELGRLPTVGAHSELFLFQLVPHASIYLGPEGMLGGEAADRIAGFWRALGIAVPADTDHLATLTEGLAGLAEREAGAAGLARERWGHARRALLGEHLLSWLPLYLRKVCDLTPGGSRFYQDWAKLFAAGLLEAAGELPPDRELPLALRSAPPLGHPEEVGADAVLAALLTPVRTGFILARLDLAGAARELGAGLRLGDRRLALRAMLEQDLDGVLTWLVRQAEQAAEQHQVEVHGSERLAGFWRARCVATGAWLEELRRSAALASALQAAERGAAPAS